MAIRVFFLALLLLVSPSFQVVRCQSDTDAEIAEAAEDSGLGIVGDDVQDFGDGTLTSAPGIETVYVFPENPGKLVRTGEETQLLVGLSNEGDAPVTVLAIRSSLHLPFDHQMLVQNLTLQEFYNASVPVSAQATFPYIFAVSKFLQPGSYDLVGMIFYEIDQQPYQTVFYNGTVEAVESGGFLSGESVFLIALGVALLVFLGFWVNGQLQQLTKKTKKTAKVEIGTATTDSSLDEWLEGTSFAQSNKSKKKK
ncbi:translocon-associated protein subunit alpha-like [Aristolochia californica]|uniref:translocon-associated protein subunit alpha-like n=1 Tax=Aristolochia californica TaxID=171875 RepID=UPI0035E08E9B